MRVVVSQTFRASRIKKGRVRGLRAILQRRARRENHSIASTARVERNREVPLFLINTFLFPSFLISASSCILNSKCLIVFIFNEYPGIMCCQSKSLSYLCSNSFTDTLEILILLMLQLVLPNGKTKLNVVI